MLCPGETGFYRCSIADSVQALWDINGQSQTFPNDVVGATVEITTAGVAYLLQQTAATMWW